MAGGLHGLRAAVRIARRDAVRSRGRTALVAAMVGLPVLVGVGGGTLVASTVPTAHTYADFVLGTSQASILPQWGTPGLLQDVRAEASSSNGGATIAPTTLADYERALAAALPEGDTVVRAIHGTVRTTSDGAPADASVLELPAAQLAQVVTDPLLAGRFPAAVGEIALDRDLARTLDVGVGDTLVTRVADGGAADAPGADPAEPTKSQVVGLVGKRDPRGGAQIVAVAGAVLPPAPANAGLFMDESETVAQVDATWYVRGDAPVTWDDVRALNALGSMVVSRDVVEHPDQIPRGEAYESESVSAGTVALVAVIAAMALIEAVLLIGPAFAVGARRSQRQLALLAAVGGDRRALRRVVLAGGLVVGLVASTVGAAAGLVVAAVWRAVSLARHSWVLPDLRVPWWLVPGAVLLGVTVSTAAAWVPARRASRVDVAAALAGRRADARPRRALPIVGLGMFATGAVAAIYGAVESRNAALVGGVLLLELGVVAAAGGLVALVARLAPFAGVAGRLALRDAARQRGRTAPAVAAVLAAVAGVAAGAVYVSSQDAHDLAQSEEPLAPGLVALSTTPDWDPRHPKTPDAAATDPTAALAALRATLPVDAAYVVRLAVPRVDADELDVDQGDWVSGIYAERAPGTDCPITGDESRAERRRLGADERCQGGTVSGAVYWHDGLTFDAVVVDDGTVVAHTGVPGAAAAAAALAAGNVVVGSKFAVWDDGTVRLNVPVAGALDGSTHTVVAPAVLVPGDGLWRTNVVLPPAVAERAEVDVVPGGALVTLSRDVTGRELVAAQEAAAAALDGANVSLVEAQTRDTGVVLLMLLGAALLIGVGSTAIAVALAGAESRPDLATLGAVGASPAVRRRVAAAQAGVIAVLGTGLGVLTGIALGRVLVTARRYQYESVDMLWQTVIPWPTLAAVALGVPLLAMAGAALLTRSQLPMVRRVVG